MLMRIKRDEARVDVGRALYRYFPMLGYAYNQGRVEVSDEIGCDIDFGDTLVRYLHSEIAYVYNTDLGEEHWMTIEDGKLLADYRSAPTTLGSEIGDPVLASFEELLSRI
jgi:hypothetical protein